MNATSNSGQAPADRRTNRRLGFAALAAPFAWFLHEVISVSIVGRTCQAGDALSARQWTVLVGVALIAATVAIAGAAIALRTFRHHTRTNVTAAEGWNRVEFIAQFAFFLNLLLLLSIVYFGLTPLLVEPCRNLA